MQKRRYVESEHPRGPDGRWIGGMPGVERGLDMMLGEKFGFDYGDSKPANLDPEERADLYEMLARMPGSEAAELRQATDRGDLTREQAWRAMEITGYLEVDPETGEPSR